MGPNSNIWIISINGGVHRLPSEAMGPGEKLKARPSGLLQQLAISANSIMINISN